ncbi:MAG: PAS domain S-box protein [Verrucomicrobia bacterium]|nr:PAS domain S-box protein [Verrucomicrobiota bacterium]
MSFTIGDIAGDPSNLERLYFGLFLASLTLSGVLLMRCSCKSREAKHTNFISDLLNKVRKSVNSADSPNTILENVCRTVVDTGFAKSTCFAELNPDYTVTRIIAFSDPGRSEETICKRINGLISENRAIFEKVNPGNLQPFHLKPQKEKYAIGSAETSGTSTGGMFAVTLDYKEGVKYIWFLEGTTRMPSIGEERILTEAATSISFAVRKLDEEQRRKATEAALRESEERFRSIFENALVGIYRTMPDGKIIVANPAIVKMLGYDSFQDLAKINLEQSGFADENPRARFKEELESKGILTNYESAWIRKDGSRIHVIENAWVVKDANGKVDFYEGTVTNITDRVQAETEVLKLNKELERRVKMRTASLEASNKELEAFSYSVSHDLRAPLRHISGFAELLLENESEKLSSQGRRHLQLIINSSKNLRNLIDDLLHFSRISRKRPSFGFVDMNKLVASVSQEFEPELQGRSLTWKIDRLPSVWGDAGLLRSVLSNLVSNAVKFTKFQIAPEIAIGVEYDTPAEVCFFAKDNGAGFDMTYTNRLFGVFQRLHHADEFEGTGIGLAIAKRIINTHGGDIRAESMPGKGATFYFTLPRRPKQVYDNNGIESAV